MPEKIVSTTERHDLPNPEHKSTLGADGVSSANIADRSVVVNLGSAKSKRIKELKRGTGTLVGKVKAAVQLVAADLGPDAEGKTLVPVVVVYKQRLSDKKKRRGGPEGMCPFCCL
jgi:hypothetical protein